VKSAPLKIRHHGALQMYYYHTTTPWAIKTCHFYFYDNFGKCGPISDSLQSTQLKGETGIDKRNKCSFSHCLM